MKHTASYIILAIVAVLLNSCEKRELCELDHPHQINVDLTVNFQAAWDDEELPYLNNPADYDVRYTYEFWTTNADGNPDTRTARHQKIGGQLKEGANSFRTTLSIPQTDVKCLVWVDLVPRGDNKNEHFDVTNLTTVTLLTYGFDPQKDAFSGSCDLTMVEGHTHEAVDLKATINAQRVLGAYKIIANDYDKYTAEKEEGMGEPTTVAVDYQLWLPVQYNCFFQRPQMATTGCRYVTQAKKPIENTCELATDVVFIGAEDNEFKYYNLVTTTFDENDVLISRSDNIEVKMQRNRIARIYGPYLTTSNLGGSVINDEFDDYIDIVIPDM